MTKLCVKVGEVVCESWCVTKLCAKESVKVVGVQSWCVTKLCEKWCVQDGCCVCDRREGGRRRAGRSTRDTESKTRTPHNAVGTNYIVA